MAFVKLNKGMTGANFKEGEPAIRMGSHRTSTGRTIYITLTRALVEQVGWEIRSTDTRDAIGVLVHEGVGDDAGYLLLESDPINGYQLGAEASKRQAFATNLQYSKLKHYVLNDDDVPSHEVEFIAQEKEKSILVQVPDWLRYNPQSYKEEKPVRPPLELVAPKGKERRHGGGRR